VISRLARIYRILGTGFGFVYFALMCLALAVTVFPIGLIRRQSRLSNEAWAQGWTQVGTSSFFTVLRVLRIAELECPDLDRLSKPGQLFVANHPTLIDAIAFMALLPQIDCVIKASHATNPILAGIVAAAGYIPNANGTQLVEDSIERLALGRSLVIFPEGTRSDPNGLNEFSRGAAHVALRAGVDPVPVTIRCEPATLYRGRAWWDVPDGKFRMTLEVGDPIALDALIPESLPMPRAARVLTAAMTEHFERRLNIG